MPTHRPRPRSVFVQCKGKVKHENRRSAEGHLNDLFKAGKIGNIRTASSYECPHCGKWHVGHDTKR